MSDNIQQILQDYLDSHTPEQLRAELDKRKHLQMVDVGGRLVPITELPWWRKDKNGWLIEIIKGHPFCFYPHRLSELPKTGGIGMKLSIFSLLKRYLYS